MTSCEIRPDARADQDNRRRSETRTTSWREPDRAGSSLVVENLDHPAPVSPAYTFCG